MLTGPRVGWRSDLGAAVEVEALKLLRSRTVRVTTALLVMVPPLMAVGFLAAAHQSGNDAVSAKAAALDLGEGWAGYLNGLTQILASAALVGLGLLSAWSFGREFVDRTVGSLYATAVSRVWIATAKLGLLVAWATITALLVPLCALVVGLVARLGWPDGAATLGLVRLAVLVLATGFLTQPVALAASAGRSYLPAFGAVAGLVAGAQVVVISGFGEWVPWSAPGLWAVAATGNGLLPLPLTRLLLAPLAAACFAVTIGWWWHQAEV